MKKFLLNGFAIVISLLLGFFLLFFGMFGGVFYESIKYEVVAKEIHYLEGSKRRVYEEGFLQLERDHRKKWVQCCSMENYLNAEIGDPFHIEQSRDGPIGTVKIIVISLSIILLIYFCIGAAVWLTEYG